MKILLAGLAPHVLDSLSLGLTARGHLVTAAALGDAPAYVVDGYCDAAVIDPGLPAPEALETVLGLAGGGGRVPVVVLARPVPPALLAAVLRSGADDLMTHPAHVDELEARLAAIARRLRGLPPGVVRCGPVTLDLAERRVVVAGRAVTLTRTEFAILEAMAFRAGRVLSRGQILSLVYGGGDEPGDTTIDVHLSHLRAKLRHAGAPGLIENAWGQGWRLTAPRPDGASPNRGFAA